MGFQTKKPLVMFRPRGDITLLKSFPAEEPRVAAAVVSDKVNVGWMVKYWLEFDDGVVRPPRRHFTARPRLRRRRGDGGRRCDSVVIACPPPPTLRPACSLRI
jgi:hypothetical protein